MNNQKNNEKPEVYVLRQEGAKWQISRRSFLKAAGIGAAIMGCGIGHAVAQDAADEAGLSDVCRSAPAHKNRITKLLISPDDKYMVTCSTDQNTGIAAPIHTVKCWDLQNGCKLIGRVSGYFFDVSKDIVTAEIDGTYCLVGFDLMGHRIIYYELPISFTSKTKELPISGEYDALAVDAAGNIYEAADGKILFYSADKSYQEQKILYEFSSETHIKSMHLLRGGSHLFIQPDENSYNILELEGRRRRWVEQRIGLYSIDPGGELGLVYNNINNTLSYIDLIAGMTRWNIDISRTEFTESDGTAIKGMVISKDGKTGFLFGPCGEKASALMMISMKDGSVLDTMHLCSIPSDPAPLAVTADGKKIMVGANSSVFIISLPDLRITELPADPEELTADKMCIVVKIPDPESGTVYTYILEQDAEIPEGSVCVCNTVTGPRAVCRCDSHTCRCDKNYSYWYPN